jgi:hypothetical protein
MHGNFRGLATTGRQVRVWPASSAWVLTLEHCHRRREISFCSLSILPAPHSPVITGMKLSCGEVILTLANQYTTHSRTSGNCPLTPSRFKRPPASSPTKYGAGHGWTCGKPCWFIRCTWPYHGDPAPGVSSRQYLMAWAGHTPAAE